MFITVICFTEKGSIVAKRIKDELKDDKVACFMKSKRAKPCSEDIKLLPEDEGIDGLVERCFQSEDAIIFVGAMGIAVRKIAPFVISKAEDPAVIVMDELSRNVIPILSGHIGGANELSIKLSKLFDANPVITTATDINESFAVDTWAKNKRITIKNTSAIKNVSAKVLNEEELKIGIVPDIIFTEDKRALYEKCDDPEILKLKVKRYMIGVGCKRDKDPSEFSEFIDRWLDRLLISIDDVASIASVDIKKDEVCIDEWARKHDIPFVIFTADELKKAEGDFTSSDFVCEKLGVDNVCERAAVCSGMFYDGIYGKLILKKIAENGMTLAVAMRMM